MLLIPWLSSTAASLLKRDQLIKGDHQAQGQHNVGCAADALALLHLIQPAKERKKDQLKVVCNENGGGKEANAIVSA